MHTYVCAMYTSIPKCTDQQKAIKYDFNFTSHYELARPKWTTGTSIKTPTVESVNIPFAAWHGSPDRI